MKKLYTIFSILVLLLLSTKSAHGSAEFTTSFTSTYTIDESGSAQVIHSIDITNKLAHIYTTSYTLAVGSDRVSNIRSQVGSTKTTASVDQNGASTTITISIPDPVIGQGQTTHLEISYVSPDIASALGNTLTVNIPRLSKANEAESFTRIVKLPQTVPPLNTVSPSSHAERLEGEERIYTFTGHPGESVTMLFGSFVTYKLNLSYEISNSTVSAADTEIALPPDTAYQQILLKSLVPAPKSIRVDSDGNWLARYPLKSQEKMTVRAELFATIAAVPSFFDPSGHSEDLNQAEPFWDVHKPVVSELGKQLKSPRNMYDYLVENFTYNYSRVKVGTDRLGSLKALENPTDTLCTEFTDTFVALARSQGVLAREINGYAYSDNTALRPLALETDILHAWPEYYDEGTSHWISVDPTWGNTTGGVNYFDKLDFNHIAFVRHGAESNYPLPAGVYKAEAKTKQIEVVVADLPERHESFETKGGVTYNTGNVALVNETVGYLPPYGEFVEGQTAPASASPTWVLYSSLVVGAALLLLVLFLVRRKK